MSDKTVTGGADRDHAIPGRDDPQAHGHALPWQRPKSTADDPLAADRLRAVLENPSYRTAEQDTAFLERDEARGPRLQLDYLKPDLLLREHGVEETIVVFGSTRIPEPAEAKRRLAAAEREACAEPGNEALARRAEVARRVLGKAAYYDVAREFGALVGETYWRELFDPEYLEREGVIDPGDRRLFWYAETARQIYDGICAWHGKAGRQLYRDEPG